MCRAPPVDRLAPGPTAEGDSDQAVPRHPTSFAECCFLPDLTRFAIRRCAGPDPQRRLERWAAESSVGPAPVAVAEQAPRRIQGLEARDGPPVLGPVRRGAGAL